eukprot:UN07067
MSPDDLTRKTGSAQLEQVLGNNPSQTFNIIMQIITDPKNETQRFAGIYMRRIFKKNPSMFIQLDVQLQNSIKTNLFKLVEMSSIKLKVRRTVCDIIEILALQLFRCGKWPELLNLITKLLNNKEIGTQTCCLYLFSFVMQGCSEKFEKNDIQNVLNLLLNIFNQNNQELRMEGLKALTRVLSITEEELKIQNIIPMIFKMLQNAANDNATAILECIMEISKHHGYLFTKNLRDLRLIMGKIVDSKDEEASHLALEILVCLAESNPPAVRRDKEYISSSIEIILKMMVSIEHPNDWNTNYKQEDENFDNASVALLRLSQAVGAPKFVGPCMARIDNLLKSDKWQYHNAGLCAMSQITEVLRDKKIKGRILLDKVLPWVKSNHPRVRWSAISAIAIFCSDYGKNFVSRNAQVILEAFMVCIEDLDNPKLCARAINCMTNFVESASMKFMGKCLGRIMQTLQAVLQKKPPQFVQMEVCMTIAEIADNVGTKFGKYYDTWSQVMLHLMAENKNGETELGAFRAFSFIGRGSGKQKLTKFAKDVQKAMKISQTFVKEDADILLIFEVWGRISEVLEEGFGEYVKPVGGVALQYAGKNVMLGESFDCDTDEGVQYVYDDNKRLLALDSNKLEEKEAGVELLGRLALSAPKTFGPMLNESITVVMPLLSFKYSDVIRTAALNALDGFCHCAVVNYQNHPDASKGFIVQCIQKCCERIKIESDISVVANIAAAIKGIFKTNNQFAKQMLEKKQVGEVMMCLINCVNGINNRINEREVSIAAPDLDEEDREDLKKENKAEYEVSQNITDGFEVLFGIYGDSVLPLLFSSMNEFSYMLGNDSHYIQRMTILRLFCYIFEKCSVDAVRPLMKQTIERFCQCSNDKDSDVVQATIYGLGLMAEKMTSQEFEKFINPLLEKLFQNTKREDLHDSAIDNHTSTIGKILKHHENKVPQIDRVYKMWLSECFPIREDRQEGPWCFQRFCELLQSQNKT